MTVSRRAAEWLRGWAAALSTRLTFCALPGTCRGMKVSTFRPRTKHDTGGNSDQIPPTSAHLVVVTGLKERVKKSWYITK